MADALGNGGAIADAAVSWLRVALIGTPLLLVTLAGNGWMRGVQDTARPLRYVLAGNGVSAVACLVLVHGIGGWDGLGLVGSAWANVAGQCVGAGLFLGALAREPGGSRQAPPAPCCAPSWRWAATSSPAASPSRPASSRRRPSPPGSARPSSRRTRSCCSCGRSWRSCSTPWPSPRSRWSARRWAPATSNGPGRSPARSTRYGLVLGIGFGVLFAALSGVLPPVFTPDAAVLAVVPVAWWFFAALQPIAGVVFAIDGVLLGAGDAAFLRTSTLAAAVFGFLPLIWASLAFGWGLAGIWSGLAAFMLVRLVAVGLRVRGGGWARTGVAT